MKYEYLSEAMRGVERVFCGYESSLDELNALLKYSLECSQEHKNAIYEYITSLNEARDRIERKYTMFSKLKSYYADLLVARYEPGNTVDKIDPKTGKVHRSCFMYKDKTWRDKNGLPIEIQD